MVLYDRNTKLAVSLGCELEATVARSIDEVIDARPDALVISTSTVDHVALVETGVEAGLPVFLREADIPRPFCYRPAGTASILIGGAGSSRISTSIRRRIPNGLREGVDR